MDLDAQGEACAKQRSEAYNERRFAGIAVTPEMVFTLLKLHDLFPDATGLQATYDFDTNQFKLKWASASFDPLQEGSKIPYHDVIYTRRSDGTVDVVAWKQKTYVP